MRRRTGILAVVTAAASLFLPVLSHAGSAEQIAANPPDTIPALREWTSGTGSYTLTATSRIVVNPHYAAQLSTTAHVLLDDLKQLTGLPITKTVQRTPRTGDIYLTLGTTDRALGDEGYTATTGPVLRVQGRTDSGVFYGTRTVLQWLKQNRTIAGGTARDWPTKPERGLMIDVGRKYFGIDWLHARLKDMAYQKLNYLHLHLSDNLGFRLESSRHPEIVSAEHYTKREIAELIRLAARYKIQIVPEIDAPGHMDQILKAHPDLKLVRNDGTVHNGFIDLSKPAAYTLIKDLVTEYLPLFPSKYWHIGADEYISGGAGSGGGSYADYPQLLEYARSHYGPNAVAKDTFYGYINWLNDIIRGYGKTTRMWNDDYRHDGSTIRPATSIVVEHWYNRSNPAALTPQQLVDAGHRVMNGHYTQTYYVLGSSRKPNLTSMYESWKPDSFHGGLSLTAETAQRNLGAKLHVWCDRPAAETPAQVATGIHAPLRVLSQQSWGTPKPVSAYTDFRLIIDAVGTAPGT